MTVNETAHQQIMTRYSDLGQVSKSTNSTDGHADLERRLAREEAGSILVQTVRKIK